MAHTSRRGLVLAGGGAKGAYAFGCMRAFRERGIEFDVVAGTSVGALNGLLWSADAFDIGEKLWREISFKSIYPVSIVKGRTHPWVIRVISSAYVALRLLWASIIRQTHPMTWMSQILIAFVLAAPLVLVASITSLSADAAGATMSVIGVVLFVAIWLLLRVGTENPQTVAWSFGLMAWWAAAVLLCVEVLGEDPVWLPMVGGSAVLAAAGGGVWLIFWHLSGDDLAVLGSAPLRKTVAGILSDRKITVPTLATAAQSIDVFDPDRGSNWHTYDASAKGLPNLASARWEPTTRREWIPVYVDLKELNAEDACDMCMASAALPFGIVPPVKVGGKILVDGGVADNAAVLPLVEAYDLDQIYVVLLKRCTSDERALRSLDMSAWSAWRRKLDVAAFPHPPSVSLGVIQ